jgi:hypothetical protein
MYDRIWATVIIVLQRTEVEPLCKVEYPQSDKRLGSLPPLEDIFKEKEEDDRERVKSEFLTLEEAAIKKEPKSDKKKSVKPKTKEASSKLNIRASIVHAALIRCAEVSP